MKKKYRAKTRKFIGTERQGRFAYESNAWKRLSPIVCYISEQYRQDDASFLELLLAIRHDTVSDKHQEQNKSRYVMENKFPENITKLFHII